MKKLLVVVCLLVVSLIPALTFAQKLCHEYEYAELKDMDKEEFTKEYCALLEAGKLTFKLTLGDRSRAAQEASNTCTETLFKMIRVYKRKFKPEDDIKCK